MPRVPTRQGLGPLQPGPGVDTTPNVVSIAARGLDPVVGFLERREEAQAKSEFNSAVGTFTKGQNDIMLGLDDVEDPTTLGDVYAERVAKLREETLGSIKNATAREEAETEFDRMAEAGRVKVFGEQNRREAESRIAALEIVVDSGRKSLRTLGPDDPLHGEILQNTINAIRLTDDLTLTEQRATESAFKAGVEKDRAEDEAEALAEASRVLARARDRAASDLFIKIRRAESGFAGLESEVEESFREGGLNAQQRTQFILSIDAQRRAVKTVFDANGFLAEMADGRLHDPGNKDQTGAIDTAYSATVLPLLEGLDPEQRAAAQGRFVEFYKRVPEEMVGEIRANLRGSPQQIVEASKLISRISGLDQGSVILSDIPNREIEFGIVASNRLEINPNAAEALQNVKDEMRVTTELKQRREFDYLDLSNALVSGNEAALNKAYRDEGLFGSGLGPMLFAGRPDIPDPMRAEFDTLVRASYIRHGDFDAAQSYALHVLGETWRESTINGPRAMMKHAPELYYANERFGADEMRKQLADDLAPFVPDNTAPEDLIVNIDTETGRDIAPDGTRQPLYPITMNGEDGIVPVLDDDGATVLWHPDFSKSPEAAQMEEEIESIKAERKKKIAAARERREANIVEDPNEAIRSFIVVESGGEPTSGIAITK